MDALVAEKLVWSVTRYGFLTLSFKAAIADILIDGKWCDLLSDCDLYITVTIGSERVVKEIYKSNIMWDQPYTLLTDTVTTYKISKTARIIIEMYDFDIWTPNDLMESWEFNPNQLLEYEGVFTLNGTGENGLWLSCSWKADTIEDKIARGEVDDFDYDEYDGDEGVQDNYAYYDDYDE